jgi:glycosyltransferase involved in cell wall biosynthesis
MKQNLYPQDKKLRILMYTRDTVGIKSIADDIANAFKEMGFDVIVSDKLDYDNYDIVHIHMDYSQFHPWGLGLIPLLIKLRLDKKKTVVTIGTILRKKDTYARNKFLAYMKNIVLSISNPLIALFSDKVTVMVGDMRETLIEDFHINDKKIAVIPHGVY